ncbi:hypothetical protein CC86DRAFT_399469 [Ophiobolus disseminans]|uniref:Kinesin light chain n=1 Tax=Ophiobolus disseminans TaxID=1469910 RepID=A0A6A7AIN2_9PLEO|nr:hypothetical protein CC86DRAFT_399469 [Ophiobolus disseminans]
MSAIGFSDANEAAELHEKVLKIYEDPLGEDHPRTHKIMDTLGANRCFQGRFKESEELHRRAVGGMTRVFRGKYEKTLEEFEDIAERLNSLDKGHWKKRWNEDKL